MSAPGNGVTLPGEPRVTPSPRSGLPEGLALDGEALAHASCDPGSPALWSWWVRPRVFTGLAPCRGPTWNECLKAHASGIVACDFFTFETAPLKTLHVLFFIEIWARRVHVGVSTSNPDAVLVTQQAHNLAMSLSDEGAGIKFLIRDRDAKFCRSFDDAFASEGIRVIRTPIRAPSANAFAQRWVETLRADCLDWTLILGPRHHEHEIAA
jgi:putative transposase